MSVTKTKIYRVEQELKRSLLIENEFFNSSVVVFQELDEKIKYGTEVYKNLKDFKTKYKRIERCIILPSRTPPEDSIN